MKQLELLRDLYGSITVPEAVAIECALRSTSWIVVTKPSQVQFALSLRSRLGVGESDAIALAVELFADRIILDDRRARTIGANLGLNVIGTVAVLVAAKKQSLIPSLGDALEDLVHTGFFVTKDIIEAALRNVGEVTRT